MEDFSWFFLYVSPFHVKKHEIRLLINVEGGLFNYLTFVVDPINLRLLLLYGLCWVNRDNLITTLNWCEMTPADDIWYFENTSSKWVYNWFIWKKCGLYFCCSRIEKKWPSQAISSAKSVKIYSIYSSDISFFYQKILGLCKYIFLLLNCYLSIASTLCN